MSVKQNENEPVGEGLWLSTLFMKAVFLVFSPSIFFLSEVLPFPLLTCVNFEKIPHFLNELFLEGKE